MAKAELARAPGRERADESAAEEEARISFRVDHSTMSLIERAASYSGETVAAYAISALIRDAQMVVHEHENMLLSDRDRDLFLSLLDNPPEPNEALRRAAREYERRVVQGERPKGAEKKP